MSIRSPCIFALTALTALTACGGAEDVATTERAAAPGDVGVALVSHTVPAALASGERRAVQVTVRNTGTRAWSTGSVALVPTDREWGWPMRAVSSVVAPGATTTFSFVVTAPATAGPATLDGTIYSLFAGQEGAFGPPLALPVTIDAARTARLACAPVTTTLPATLAPGERRLVDITVRNVGLDPWPGDGSFCLYQRDGAPGSVPSPDDRRWGGRFCEPNRAGVAPGASHTFRLPIDAPTTSGTYSFSRQMFDGRAPTAQGIGFFDVATPCVDLTVLVSGSPPLDAVVVSHTLLPTMDVGAWVPASVTLRNSGTAAWPADGSILLHSRTAPSGLFGRHVSPIPAAVAPGQTVQVDLPVRAPALPGAYVQSWQLYATSGQYFGEALHVPTTVQVPAAFDAAVETHDLPAMMAAGQSGAFVVRMRNDGPQTWPADGSFGLAYVGAPIDRWGTQVVPLTEATGPGEEVDFVLPLTAPAVAGGYRHRWRMHAPGGVGFGQTVDAPVTVLAGAPLSINTAALPAGQVGQAYRAVLAGQGGVSPAWGALGLPDGLSLVSGEIVGVPTRAGAFSVALSLTEPGYTSAQVSLPLTVAAAAPVDAGVPDLGTVDAGFVDAGAPDGGGPPPVTAAPWRWGAIPYGGPVQTPHAMIWDGARVWTVGHAGGPAGIRMFDLMNEQVERSIDLCAAAPHVVWTGDRALVFGGLDCTPGVDLALQRGWVIDPFVGRYVSSPTGPSPESVTKTPMDETTVPGPRAGGVAFWAGHEMLVFGGTCPQPTCYTQGARYDPAIDRWSTMSTVGAPAATGTQVGVWTGQALLVFGGSAASSGRWDRATDTWAPISQPSFPLGARAAVWTGAQMIAWDGARGGRYDPATDTWSPLSSVGAPVGVHEVRAVWTGAEVIVMHSHGGAHYTPATDTWQPIDMAHRIRVSRGRQMIWTGQEVFVGDDTIGGGRYRPRQPGESGGCPGEYPGSSLSANIVRPYGLTTKDHLRSISGGGFGGVAPRTTRLFVNGALVSTTGRADIWFVNCAPLCRLRVNVTDAVGNSACMERLLYDDAPAAVTVSQPVAGSIVPAGPVPFQASCVDAEGPCQIRFRGPFGGSSVSGTIDLSGAPGQSTLLFFEAIDSRGQLTRRSVQVGVQP